jgi:hypothetical protein
VHPAQQQAIIDEFAPGLWKSLKSILEREPGVVIEAHSDERVTLTRPGSSQWLSLEYALRPLVWWRTPGPNGYLKFQAIWDSRGVKVLDPRRNALMFADEAAALLVSYFNPTPLKNPSATTPTALCSTSTK